jgi:hypothetical protein
VATAQPMMTITGLHEGGLAKDQVKIFSAITFPE